METLRRRAMDGLQKGDIFSTSRTFTDEDVSRFAQMSRDYNPVHFDDRFAKARKFSAPICHGLLTACLVTEIGGQIGWLASSMDLRFKAPVYVGETIKCDWVITSLDENGRAKAVVKITKNGGITVMEADIGGIIPQAEERRILKQMLSEGDPTNGPTRTQLISAGKPEP